MADIGMTRPINFLSLRWIVRLISTFKSFYFTENADNNTNYSGLWKR